MCYKNRERTSLTCVMPSLQYTDCIKWNISITVAPKETQYLNTDPSFTANFIHVHVSAMPKGHAVTSTNL